MFIAQYILIDKKLTYTIETIKDWNGNIIYFDSRKDAMDSLAFLHQMENAFTPNVLEIKE